MRLFGLIGYPLGHSFSKNYFSKKFENEGIEDCAYELFPVENIEKLPAILKANPQLQGLNVTIPYKREVLKYLNNNRVPEGLEACNCIVIGKGELTGYNTDVTGFERSFLEKWNPWQNKALILGAGGAAAAVIFVFKKLGISYLVAGRTKKAGVDFIYEELTGELIADTPVIVNCTPLGMYPKSETCPPILFKAVSDKHYLFDLVYNPVKTLFLAEGEKRGATIENGLNMLIYQAEEGWRIWNEAR
jgi:shikimate dehydrogenase